VASVKKVSDLIADIAAASQEQSSGIEQVNTAVSQMDQVVQQNASLVEEAAAATESMKGQAATLLEMVSRFKLGDGEQAPRVAVKQAPAAAARPAAGAIGFKPGVVAAPHFAAAAPAARPHAGNGEWSTF
jgi:hypothetical protein